MRKRIVSDEIIEMSRDRRDFMKKITAGSAGLVLASQLPGDSVLAQHVTGGSDVSFVTGTDRRDMMYQVLKPLESEIKRGIKEKQVIIKANLVGPDELCAPHVDAVRGVLDFLKPIYKNRVILGDSTGRQYPGPMSTFKHFEIHNYLTLPDEYNVNLSDFNDNPFTKMWIVDNKFHPLGINIINTFHDPNNYMISLTRLKTHNSVVATLSVKNMVMGSPVNHYRQKAAAGRNEKSLMHTGGPKGINFSIFLVSKRVRPQLCVIDGTVGMEGNGPTQGTAVEHGVALAGTDVLSVDRTGVKLMGINYDDIGYLNYMADAGMGQDDLSKIRIIGDANPDDNIIKYKLHENIEEQMQWKEGLVQDI
ncbi:DUF362 domain-containing protein [Candidatus Latescibacterota bacterium]